MDRCEACRQVLPLYLEDELEDRELEFELRDHLRECATCREEARDYLALTERIVTSLEAPRPLPSPSLAPRRMSPSSLPPGLPRRRVLAAALLLLALTLSFAAYRQPASRAESGTASPVGLICWRRTSVESAREGGAGSSRGVESCARITTRSRESAAPHSPPLALAPGVPDARLERARVILDPR